MNVQFLEKVDDEIVGPDGGATFGPFEEGKTYDLPPEIAEPFVEQGIARKPEEDTIVGKIPSKINAEMVGREVEVRGRIVAEKSKKALPREIRVRCLRCEHREVVELDDEDYTDIIFKGRKRLDTILAEIGKKALVQLDCVGRNRKHWVRTDEVSCEDYAIVWLEDRLEDMSEFRGNRKSQLKVALIGKEVPNAQKVRVVGKIEVDPRSTDMVLLAREIEPLESAALNFELTDEELRYFTHSFEDTDKLLPQIAPDMVGRDLVRESRLLTLHSPQVIPDVDGGRLIRGCIRECLFGDTKTYKSESVKDITTQHYQLGDYCTGETGSRAGLIYSVDTDKGTIRWGVLPLNDGGYVGIDGLNNIYSEEMHEFREVLEDQRVIVRKFVSGEAPARVRITGCMNPPEPMSQYITNCQAIKDAWIFKKTPDITRWDIFIPFSDWDVPKEDIVNRTQAERPIPDEVFKKSVWWAWSRRPENIHYEEEAVKKIKSESPRLIEEYGIPTLPIVHNGIRDVITRLSVAYACLTHSTEDHENVIVGEESVEGAINFYERVLAALQLRDYRQIIKQELSLDQEEFMEIVRGFTDTHIAILDALKTGPKPSSELSEELGVSGKTVKRKYGELRNHKLIETKRGKGVTLTPKGVRFVKKILFPDRDKKCPYVPNGSADTIPTLFGKWDSKSGSARDKGTKSVPNESLMRELGLLYERLAADIVDGDISRGEFVERFHELHPDVSRERIGEAINYGKDQHGWIFPDDYEKLGAKTKAEADSE